MLVDNFVNAFFLYDDKLLLTFTFKDGTTREAVWKDRSRADSWTPEMKAKAREDYERRTKCRK